VEASGNLTLEFARGTLGTVIVSTRADYRTPLEVVGEGGVLQADNGLTVDHPIEMRLRPTGQPLQRTIVNNASAYARQVDAFAATVSGEGEFPVPGLIGWQNQGILDAAFRSVKSGRTENVRQVTG
jgi:predicted dehydrogenase